MDARTFLGIDPLGDRADLRWRLAVTPALATRGNFLFGGCGLGAALVALEAVSGRPPIWATAQYLSFAMVDETVDYQLALVATGRRATQARAVARVGDREILTVNAALGAGRSGERAVWEPPLDVPPPRDCPPRRFASAARTTVIDRIDVRQAKGALLDDLGAVAGPDSALWVRIPDHLSPSAATLAIFGDLVTVGLSQLLGRPVVNRSLDNTLRVIQLVPTDWVLCDIRIHAAVNGYAHGRAFLRAEEGTLLATASQSMSYRFEGDRPSAQAGGTDRND